MAKFKLTLKNSFAMMFALIGSFVSSGVYAQDAEKLMKISPVLKLLEKKQRKKQVDH